MPFKSCNHLKENGTYCRSAALRGRDYCYFHSRLRARRLAMQQAKSQNKSWRLNLPALEDMHAVQSALMEVLDALAAGCLSERRASLLLYGLQQAASNLRSPMGWSSLSGFEIDPEVESRAESYPALEAEFGLPKRLNLDTPPEKAFPPMPAPAQPAASATTDDTAQQPRPSASARDTGRRPPASVTASDTGRRPPASVKPPEVLTGTSS